MQTPMAVQGGPPPYDENRIRPGTVLSERYRIEATLGEGGMGIVYLAEHVHMRKRVAIKVLLPEWTSAAEVVARFEREAVVAGTITHPNVAAATDFGRLPDGSFFLVLEYLEGRTLRHALGAGPLGVPRALAIARSIALGIGAAHAKGIVHRDLKPENVMLVRRDGDPEFVKVLDFGIARDEQRSAQGGALTSVGAILGTPDYMAPEQALGRQIDGRADLYALGVILFEMLAGECPFRGGAVTLLRQHVLTPAPPLPLQVIDAVPPDVRAVVARALEKEAGARFATAADLVAAIDACIASTAPPRSHVIAADPRLDRADAHARYAATPGHRAHALLDRLRRAAAAVMASREAEKARRAAKWAHARATDGAVRAVAAARRKPAAAAIAGLGGVVMLTAFVALVAIGRTRSPRPAALASASASSTPSLPVPPRPTATADVAKLSPLTCLGGAFGDHVERGEPVGDATTIAGSERAIYWLDIENTGKPTEVTLVWVIDGVEVQRQSLRVGRGPHWRTWGSRALKGGRVVAVKVLDAEGDSLKEDSIRLEG